MAEKLSGTVHRTYFTSPKFSAGVLQTDIGDRVRFRGPFCANEGEFVTLEGRWKDDPKYGRQFRCSRCRYELPQTAEGLVQYLARHPAFVGIGEATARKIVAYASSPEQLDRLIRLDLDDPAPAAAHSQGNPRKPPGSLDRPQRRQRGPVVPGRIRPDAPPDSDADRHVRQRRGRRAAQRSVPDLSATSRVTDSRRSTRSPAPWARPRTMPVAWRPGCCTSSATRQDPATPGFPRPTWSTKANDLLLLDTLDSREVIRGRGPASAGSRCPDRRQGRR